MSTIVFPHFQPSIPFSSFKPTTLNLNSKKLSFTPKTRTNHACFSRLPESEPTRPENTTVSTFPDEVNDGFNNASSRPGDQCGIVEDLKRAFLDTVYGTEFGYRCSTESQGRVLELVDQLEAANPTPAPTQRPDLLDGNWILLYTAFSELLPLLATGSLPLIKIETISESIDLNTLKIKNSTTISSPIASWTFSVAASIEVPTPSIIEVLFPVWTFKYPELKSDIIKLPMSFDIFGQKINLSFLQRFLYSLQNAVAHIARSISCKLRNPAPAGDDRPPIRIPILSSRKSQLVITYLDNDLRICRADGSLYVLVKEGSPLCLIEI